MACVFRRRTTDQVYATLQQVQRRISEAGNSPGALSSQGAKPMPAAPAIRPAAPTPGTGSWPAPGTGSFPAPGTGSHPAPVPLAPPASDRAVIHLPISLAITLGILMVFLCAVFFVVGQWFGSRGRTPGPVAPVEVDEAPKPVVAERPKAAGFLLLLKSKPSATAADKADFEKEAKRLNDIMVKNAARGWKPLFTVREPPSGHLQLVFGKDGDHGVDRDAWADFQRIMSAPTTKNGAGYTSATWIPANE